MKPLYDSIKEVKDDNIEVKEPFVISRYMYTVLNQWVYYLIEERSKN